MNENRFPKSFTGYPLSAEETKLVSGGVLEKENVYPRKPGQTEVAVYVDGTYLGTAHVNPGDPIGRFNPPFPNNA